MIIPTLASLSTLTLEQKRSLRNQLFADALRPEIERRAAALQNPPALSPIPATVLAPLLTKGKGTPTAQLRAMSNDQLVARYETVCSGLAAPNFVPTRLRAPGSTDSRQSHAVLQSERVRIRRIASERGLDLREEQIAAHIQTVHAAGVPAPDELKIGDRVHVTYRNPHSTDHEMVESDGEIIKTENGRWGLIFITRLSNGQTLPFSKSNLKRKSEAPQ